MKREEAIKELKKAYPKKSMLVNYRIKGGFDDHDSPLGQALDIAIKALEQEPILDKIRERISLEKLGYPPSAGYYKAIVKVLDIIDKYKESEEEE